MTQKSRLLVGLLLLFLLFAGTNMVRAQEKSYVADRFDVDVVVEEGGSLLVTETVVYDFTGGPFTFIFREVPTDHTDGITVIETAIDGQPYPFGDAAGQVELEDDDPLELKWHLAPTSDAVRTVTLTYRVAGVVRDGEGGDELRWQVLPDDYDFHIASSTTTVRWPAGTALVGSPRVLDGEAQLTTEASTAVFQARDLEPDTPLVVSLVFPANSVIEEPPAWQQQDRLAVAQAPIWTGAGILFAMVALGLMWLQYRTVKPAGNAVESPIYEPPTALAPGLAGTIVAANGGATWGTALGTLFDLAEQGVLEIDESPEKKWYRRHDFFIRLLERPLNLAPHQEALLALLFDRDDGPSKTVKFSEMSKVVTSGRWKRYVKSVEAELKSAQFFSPERKQMRQRLMLQGFALVLAGIASIVVPINRWAAESFLILSLAVFSTGLGIVIGGATLTPLSDTAVALAAEWKRFAAYLKRIAKGKETVVGTHTFVKYLPYAAAFGILPQWARRFKKEGVMALPAYFNALPGSNPADSMTAFVAMSATSGSAGGAAGGAAGGGAAGGGAAGAG